MLRRCLLLFVFVLVGCGDSHAGTDGGSPDAWPDGWIAVPGPEGALGVCCPRDPSPEPCGCAETGGWAPGPSACTSWACDPPAWRSVTDEWGCDEWWPGVDTEVCCGFCPDP